MLSRLRSSGTLAPPNGGSTSRDSIGTDNKIYITAPQFRVVTLNPLSILKCQGAAGEKFNTMIWPGKRTQDRLAIELIGSQTIFP